MAPCQSRTGRDRSGDSTPEPPTARVAMFPALVYLHARVPIRSPVIPHRKGAPPAIVAGICKVGPFRNAAYSWGISFLVASRRAHRRAALARCVLGCPGEKAPKRRGHGKLRLQ